MDALRIRLESIDSTNTYAKNHSSSFAPDQLTCITAEEQTAGRGRFQRKWLSPPHVNLYVTFFFRLPGAPLHLQSLGQVLAYSLSAVLLRKELTPRIKWPNDVLLQGKKLAGILCETLCSEKETQVFLGIGVNVNMPSSLLSQIDQPATSLLQETGKLWDKEALLQELEQQFASDLGRFKKEGFFPFHDAIETLLAYKGEKISCFDGKKEWEGICHSLTYDGQLNLYLPDRRLYAIFSGEISTRAGC